MILFLALMMFCGLASAETFDTLEETITVNKAKIDTIALSITDKIAVIQIFKGYEVEGKLVTTKIIQLRLENKVDDPETPEDETDNSYTALMNTITINKPALRTLIKSKL